MNERIPPNQCLPSGDRPARCFFCQQVDTDTGLRHTKVEWKGRKVNTLICRKCMTQMNVPETYPEAFRTCYFCGHPGDLKESYQQIMSSPPVGGASVGSKNRLRKGIRVRVCQQCLGMFVQLDQIKGKS